MPPRARIDLTERELLALLGTLTFPTFAAVWEQGIARDDLLRVVGKLERAKQKFNTTNDTTEDDPCTAN